MFASDQQVLCQLNFICSYFVSLCYMMEEREGTNDVQDVVRVMAENGYNINILHQVKRRLRF